MRPRVLGDRLLAAAFVGAAAALVVAALLALIPEASSGGGAWRVPAVVALVGFAVGARMGRDARASGGRAGRGALAGVGAAALGEAVVLAAVALTSGTVATFLEAFPVLVGAFLLGLVPAAPLGALAGAAFYRLRGRSAPPDESVSG